MNGILFCFFVFEIGPYCVFLAGLELEEIWLPLPLQSWY